MSKIIQVLAIFVVVVASEHAFAKDIEVKHPSSVLKRTCLSLKTLEKEARKHSISDKAFQLAGIGWFEFAIADRANNDLILCGKVAKGWPSLSIDDLVVNLRNIMRGEQYPYCSLDPKPENILKLNKVMSQQVNISDRLEVKTFVKQLENAIGPQQVVIGGVPKDSHHAYTMIDADYHMKKVSQGHEKITGVPSMLDISLSDMKQAIDLGHSLNMGASMSRFWFHVEEGHPKFEVTNDAALLSACSVVVLTEKQRAGADGTLSDSNEDDENAIRFAEHLSEHFQQAATSVNSYANLENLYRLHALLKVIKKLQLANNVYDFRFFLTQYNYKYGYNLAPSLPGLVNGVIETISTEKGNYITNHILLPLTVGGVSMEMFISPLQMRTRNREDIKNLAKAIIASRPRLNALYWTVVIR